MSFSPRLSLPYLSPQQAQKHVTVNEALRLLDAIVQLAVTSRVTLAQPAAPAEGESYILPADKTGVDWSQMADHAIVVYQDGAWSEVAPVEGWRAYVADENLLVVYDGSSWNGVGGGSSETAAKFGVNTTADPTNRLTAKSDAILFSHDDVTPGSGDCQVKVNKGAAANTASHLFQTGFSGRAEFGLTGDDDFHIKVSPDNFTTSYEAVTIDKDNGYVGIGGAPSFKMDILHAGSNAFSVYRPSKNVGDFTSVAYALNDSNDERQQYAAIDAKIVSNTAGLADGRLIFATTRGGVSLARAQVHDGFFVGSPVGGDKGLGAINAQAVYDDNTLLSCYVFDQVLDGVVDIEKWDAKVPDLEIAEDFIEDQDPHTGRLVRKVVSPKRIEVRRHDPARKFVLRIDGKYDPLTLDGYAAHWREKRHLTSMPNEEKYDPVDGTMGTGEWIQRLVETVEIQAVLIEQLHQRIKVVENKAGSI